MKTNGKGSSLRGYQLRAADEAVRQLAKKRNLCIQAPCGSGKTEIAIEILRRTHKLKWLFIVHTNVLAEQTERRFREAGIDVERYGISDDEVPDAPVIIASIQLVLIRDVNRKLKPDAICFDEAHHYEARNWSQLCEWYPNALRLGMTATPQRQDGKSLLRHFDEIYRAASYKELIRERVLVTSHVWAPTTSGPAGLAWDPIEAWNNYSEGTKTLVAFGKIAEARLWAERFNSVLRRHGKRAACVDGETAWSFNHQTIEDFRAGKIDVLTNVYYVTEGFDLPDIGCIILARRFGFRSTYMQFVGRALRVAPGKRYATVIDLTGCTHRHGVPHNDRPWHVKDHEPPHVPLRDYHGEREGVPRMNLGVSGEGLVCVCPVTYADGQKFITVPERQPLIKGLKIKKYDGERALLEIEARARKIAGRKVVEVARAWAERERRRHVSLIEE